MHTQNHYKKIKFFFSYKKEKMPRQSIKKYYAYQKMQEKLNYTQQIGNLMMSY